VSLHLVVLGRCDEPDFKGATPKLMKDYASVATQYARDVTDGRVLACRWVRLACVRHLNDLQRDAAGWRFTWNPELETTEGKKYRPADRVCHFIELLPHIKGEWAANRQSIHLEPWQVFVVASIFGWVDRDTCRRRFRIADLFVPRKNAKSTIAAGIGLYMAFCDGEHGAEVYSGATSEAQAGETFKPAKLMAEKSPEFIQRFGVTVRVSNISSVDTNSKFEPVIGKPGDGASPSCAIVDEYHEHQTEDLYETMRTGMGARKQPLMLVITTAGDNISGPCYAHQKELEMVLNGLIEDEQRFGIIYTIDQDEDGKLEDWTTEEAVMKANPNFGVSIDEEFMLSQLRDAIRDPRKQATFQTKHLNLWVASASPWLSMQSWKSAADKALKIEDFRGESFHEGVDLANTTDITSRCKIFKRNIDGKDHFYAFWKHYLPENVINEPENRHYQGWLAAGQIIATDGNMIDQARIEADILAEAELYHHLETAFDPWGAPGIIGNLQNEGFEVLTVRLTAQFLSAPMKYIDGLLKDGRLHHDGDPVAAWGVNNVEVKPDQNDNWFPRKQNRYKKTDPGIALILAMCRAMAPTQSDVITQAFVAVA
jgi:phage terminase large subunit-like protein